MVMNAAEVESATVILIRQVIALSAEVKALSAALTATGVVPAGTIESARLHAVAHADSLIAQFRSNPLATMDGNQAVMDLMKSLERA